MNALSLALKSRVLRFAAVAALASVATACSGGSADDASAQNDATMDSAGAVDAQDAPRLRDVGREIDLDSAFGQCFVMISPRTGTTADTFMITGSGILNASTATLTVSPEGAGGAIISTQVPVSNGMFEYSVPGSMLTAGDYRVDVNDPSFTCSTFGPFTVL